MDDEGAGDDPFGSLIPICHVSSSQEERLRRCPFAPEPYNPKNDSSSDSEPNDDIRVESVGIVMVSPPETEEEDNDNSNSHEVFHTPPEEGSVAGSSNELQPPRNSDCHGGDCRNLEATDGGGCGETVAGGVGFAEASGMGTVDLSRDSDLGFSEVELGQRVEPDLGLNRSRLEDSRTELEEFRVSRRELGLEDGLEESQLKKLKISEQELESERESPQSDCSDLIENHEINGAKRKLEFTENDEATEVVELEKEANDSVLVSGNGERINDKDKLSAKEFIETMAMLGRDDIASETEEAVIENEQSPPRRRLPSSIIGEPENARKDRVRTELTLLDVLKLIGEDRGDDTLSCSFLEMAKRRGMTFPRPVSWPDPGTNFGEDDS